MSSNKEFILQHEDTKLALFRYNGTNIETESIVVNDKTTHILPFLSLSSEKLESKIAKWIINRGIPVTRDDIKDIAGKTNFIPSASLKGDLKKKWIIDEQGARRLVKGNYGKSCRQSLCEVLATEIHKRQGKFEYTPYSLIQISSNGNKVIGCECPNFTDINTEFIPAIEIINSEKKSSSLSYYDQYIQICNSSDTPLSYIEKMC